MVKSKFKLWLSKTETKYVKGEKLVGFIKTCDQYPHTFNFSHCVSFLIVSSPCYALSAGENSFSKNATWGHRLHWDIQI